MPDMDGDIVAGNWRMAEIRADREHTTESVYCRVKREYDALEFTKTDAA
jgi:hypothetical protein